MFNFNFKRKEYGFVIAAAGVGIMLGLILPPWGWMIGCGIGLIVGGIFWSKSC